MRCYCCNNGKWSYAIGGDIATRITRIFKLVERKAFVDFMGTEAADLKNGSLFSIFRHAMLPLIMHRVLERNFL